MNIDYCPTCDDNSVTDGLCWICGADFNQRYIARPDAERRLYLFSLTRLEITRLRRSEKKIKKD